jgi:hypothetical protein
MHNKELTRRPLEEAKRKGDIDWNSSHRDKPHKPVRFNLFSLKSQLHFGKQLTLTSGISRHVNWI